MTCSVGGELSRSLQESGIPVRVLLGRLVKQRFSLAFARKLRKLIKREGSDLVHAHLYASVTAAAVPTLGQNVPLVITEGSWRSWRTRMSRWVYRRAKHVVAVSNPIRRLLLDEYGVSPECVILVPNAVTPVSDGTPGESPSLSDEWREGLLVDVAQLKPEKGLDASNTVATLGARLAFHLPYFHACMSLERRNRTLHFASRRTRPHIAPAGFEAVWTVGERLPPSEPGSLKFS